MKRLFGENAMDRGLLRVVVIIYARTNGMEYESAHQLLRSNRARLKVDHFKTGSDADGAGFRGDDPPTVEGELDSMFETERRPDA